MNFIELVTGDDNLFDLLLKRNGHPVAIPPTAVVRALVVSEEQPDTTVGPIVCSNAAPGADWGHGIVVVEFDAATSESLPIGRAYVEVEVNDGVRRTTWFYRHVTVSKGLIQND